MSLRVTGMRARSAICASRQADRMPCLPAPCAPFPGTCTTNVPSCTTTCPKCIAPFSGRVRARPRHYSGIASRAGRVCVPSVPLGPRPGRGSCVAFVPPLGLRARALCRTKWWTTSFVDAAEKGKLLYATKCAICQNSTQRGVLFRDWYSAGIGHRKALRLSSLNGMEHSCTEMAHGFRGVLAVCC